MLMHIESIEAAKLEITYFCELNHKRDPLNMENEISCCHDMYDHL
jgi:hypothetical protein